MYILGLCHNTGGEKVKKDDNDDKACGPEDGEVMVGKNKAKQAWLGFVPM